MRSLAILFAGLAAVGASAATASAPPVGQLPAGRTTTLRVGAGDEFTVALAKPTGAGRVWRVARAYDSGVVREVTEADTATGLSIRYHAVAPGTTDVVYAVTRGERPHAYAAQTFHVVVGAPGAAAGSSCPRGLLPLGANAIGPAVAAALAADPPSNRAQVTGATLAPQDAARGPQAKSQCGATVWQRTVVVYIVDRALLPAESASQRVVFVGRTKRGYLIWQRVH